MPRLDAVALYRWNGLSGTLPNGERLASAAGQFPDWTLGVNFSVPLGLRDHVMIGQDPAFRIDDGSRSGSRLWHRL